MKLFPWFRYSKKLKRKISLRENVGTFDDARGMKLVEGQAGDIKEGNFIKFY